VARPEGGMRVAIELPRPTAPLADRGSP
jgi:hypothetical protein